MSTNSARAAALVGFALAMLGCGASTTPSPYHGVLWLSWTIAGQPPSETSCAGIDHLMITVESTPSSGVKIAPILCTTGASWERDDVPEGSDTIVIDAVDATDRAALERVSMVGVTDARPATPTVIDLQPL